MKKNESNTARENANFGGMMGVVMISVLFLVVGGIMIFFPGISIANFVYVIGGFFLVGGAWEIARYFIREEYRNLANFDFSIGVLALIAGVIFVLRAEQISSFMYALLGAMVLILGVTLLQHTFALHALKSIGWIITLLFSVALILFSLAMLLDFNGLFSVGNLTYYLLIASGILGLGSLLCVGLRIRHYENELMVQKKRDLDDDFFHMRDADSAPAIEAKTEEEPAIDMEPEQKGIEAKADPEEDSEDEMFEDEGIEEEEKEKRPTFRERLTAHRAKRKNQEPNEAVFEEE